MNTARDFCKDRSIIRPVAGVDHLSIPSWSSVPLKQGPQPLRPNAWWSEVEWCNKNGNKVYNKCSVLESSHNHLPNSSPCKYCLPQNWSLVPERLGTTTRTSCLWCLWSCHFPSDLEKLLLTSYYKSNAWEKSENISKKNKSQLLSSVQFSCSVMSDSLQCHESQHARPPCPSPTSGVHSDSRPSSRWCHPAISSSVILFSSCPQSFPASESFLMSQLFAWRGQVLEFQL